MTNFSWIVSNSNKKKCAVFLLFKSSNNRNDFAQWFIFALTFNFSSKTFIFSYNSFSFIGVFGTRGQFSNLASAELTNLKNSFHSSSPSLDFIAWPVKKPIVSTAVAQICCNLDLI